VTEHGDNIKPNRFQQTFGTTKRTLLGKCQKQNLLKFCRVIVMPMRLLEYGFECWSLMKKRNEKNGVSRVMQNNES
jgi:hypothetical protein